VIHVVGLREYFNQKTQKWALSEKFFDKGWRAENLSDLFNRANLMEAIPESERFNLFYTLHHSHEGKGRAFDRGYVVAFDIDKMQGVTKDMSLAVAQNVCKTIGVDFSKVGVVFSGRGVHVLVEVIDTWSDPKFFEDNRFAYKALCKLIDVGLQKEFGSGKCDSAIFDAARIMRLPGTENRKRPVPGEGEWQVTKCELVKGDISAQDFSLVEAAGLDTLEAQDTIPLETARKFGKVDEKAIMLSCGFMRHCKEEPQNVSEPEWYAMLSIAGRFDNPVEAAHALSKGHPSYSPEFTEAKLDQAMGYGPRTCKSIDETWQNSKCHACPKWGKISTPLLIRGPDHIFTEDTGFHFYFPDKNGKIKCGKPDYEGLRRFYNRQNEYIVMPDSENIFTWDGKKWNLQFDLGVKGFAQQHFNPLADTNMCNEFFNIVMRNNHRAHEWFDSTTQRKMNFENGVLDIDTMEFHEHSKLLGFRKVLPYSYDPGARAPRFEQYLQEVTLGRQELIDILLEFAGYSLSNDSCWEQKCVVLQGDGANGKSKFVEVLCALAGEGNYSAMTLVDLERDTNRFSLDGSLFNISEETPSRSLVDSSLFKNLTGGGKVMVKQLYKQPYEIQNRAKLWLLCNEMPRTSDMTFGMMRRLVIVPFDAKFVGKNDDKKLISKLLAELPGILNLILDAYKKMKLRGSLQSSEIVRQKLEDYADDVDNVRAWWKENVEVLHEFSENDFEVSAELYNSYKKDMIDQGEKFVTSTGFYKKVSRIFPAFEERSGRVYVQRLQKRIIRGIRNLNKEIKA